MELTHYNLDAFNVLLSLRREGRISWRALGLGAVIASFVNKDTGEAWPSRATLSATTGISARHVSSTIRELEQVGFLATKERSGVSNIYRLTLDQIGTPVRSGTLDQIGRGPLTKTDQNPCPNRHPINEDKSNNNETTTSLKNDTSIPKDKPKDNSFPQENQPPPLIPAPSAADSGKRKAKPKPNQHPTWRLWLRVNQDVGQPAPLEEKASLAAAKKMAAQIPGPNEQEAIMRAYLEDKTDKWAIDRGSTLSILVSSRLSKCRKAAVRTVEEQAADDADLIRQAKEEFPDPDEMADFFYQRQKRGLRVPSGVDCRPMPAEKEVAV